MEWAGAEEHELGCISRYQVLPVYVVRKAGILCKLLWHGSKNLFGSFGLSSAKTRTLRSQQWWQQGALDKLIFHPDLVSGAHLQHNLFFPFHKMIFIS